MTLFLPPSPSHLGRGRRLGLLARCAGLGADLRVVCLHVTLQVLQALKLHPALGTPQASQGLVALRVSRRGRASDLIGALAVGAPEKMGGEKAVH